MKQDDTSRIDNTALFTQRLVDAQVELFAYLNAMMPFYPSDVSDVVQEVNLALIQHARDYDPTRSFRAWMFAFAKRQLQKFFREKGQTAIAFDSELTDKVAKEYTSLLPDRDGPYSTVSMLRQLAACKKKLNASQLDLLDRRYRLNKSVEEIAREKRANAHTVTTTLAYIRTKLGDCIRRLCRLDEKCVLQEPTPEETLANDILEHSATNPPDVQTRFQNALRASPGSRLVGYWVRQNIVHTLLQSEAKIQNLQSRFLVEHSPATPRSRKWLLAAAALFFAFIGIAALLFEHIFTIRSIAVITNTYCACWEDGRPVKVGQRLFPNEWRWGNGVIEITTRDHTTLIIEAPAVLQLLDEKHIRLSVGGVVVKMREGSSGFVVDSPEMKVIDLGTEFGVRVASDGNARVQVFDGKVVASANRQQDACKVVNGEMLTASREGLSKPSAFSHSFFIRHLPQKNPDAPKGGLAYNKSQYSSMDVFPAEKPVVIDASLDEWPATPTFRSACNPPYDKTYAITARLLYDATNLYLAAEVADPSPMQNRNTGKWESEYAGGSVICRLAVDDEIGYPLQGAQISKGRILSGQDVNRHLVSLVCWFDALAQRPRLLVERGRDMRFRRNEFPAEGWKGMFKKRADGLGYTMEYAIAWSAFHAVPPPPGSIRANTWNIHWSDAQGMVSHGQLVENVDTGIAQKAGVSLTECYNYLQDWGKLVFQGQTRKGKQK